MDSQYLHMIGNLGLVVVFMLVGVYWLKRSKFGSQLNNKHINIVNCSRIGTKEKLFLVEVNKTMLLIGATPNHIETLYVFDAKEDALKENEKERVFADVLRTTSE